MTYNLLKLYVLIDMGYFFVFNFLYLFLLSYIMCISYGMIVNCVADLTLFDTLGDKTMFNDLHM